MTSRVFHPWRSYILPALFAVVSFALASKAQGQANPPVAATVSAYDVVSIRPHKPGPSEGFGWRMAAEGFSARPIQPQRLIMLAFGLRTTDQIVNLPAWASADSFDIKAKLDEATAAEWQKLPDAEIERRHRPMLQSLLADRLELKVHHEVRQLSVFRLVVAKNGPKLKVSPAGTSAYSGMSNGFITGQGISMDAFVFNLSNEIGHQVVDETGLTSNYDLTLTWAADEMEAPSDLSRSSPGADPGPSVFAAIQEQLGLKLIPSKGPVDVIVIDHMERPSEN
jgi:uncharacterized protein (TIGR03435 family)